VAVAASPSGISRPLVIALLMLVAWISAWVVPVVLFVPALLLVAAAARILHEGERARREALVTVAALVLVVVPAARIAPAAAVATGLAGAHAATAWLAHRWWAAWLGIAWTALPYAGLVLPAIALAGGLGGWALRRARTAATPALAPAPAGP
jgi:hypothetical protein